MSVTDGVGLSPPASQARAALQVRHERPAAAPPPLRPVFHIYLDAADVLGSRAGILQHSLHIGESEDALTLQVFGHLPRNGVRAHNAAGEDHVAYPSPEGDGRAVLYPVNVYRTPFISHHSPKPSRAILANSSRNYTWQMRVFKDETHQA